MEDAEKTEPDASGGCTAMGQETGTGSSNHKLELGKLDFLFNLFIYYHEGGLDKSLGAKRWTGQPAGVPSDLKYFMILWNLIEMPSLDYCISCFTAFNQTTKENTPSIWESKHM